MDFWHFLVKVHKGHTENFGSRVTIIWGPGGLAKIGGG